MTEPDSPEPVPAPTNQLSQNNPTNPFAPRYREPWVNPAKRTAALIGGLAAAVVLLALGFLAGLGVGGGGHRHEFRGPMMRPDGMYGRRFEPPYGMPGHRFVDPRPHPGLPPRRYQQPNPATPPVSPGPSSSHS